MTTSTLCYICTMAQMNVAACLRTIVSNCLQTIVAYINACLVDVKIVCKKSVYCYKESSHTVVDTCLIF